jgi:erythromycin esterase-like protein
MNRLFRRLRLTIMAVEKKTPDGLAANQSMRHTAAIHTPKADLYNEPCSMWTTEALSRTDLPSDTGIFNL